MEQITEVRPAVAAVSIEYAAKARALADALQTEYVADETELRRGVLRLLYTSEGLVLTDGELRLRGDFTSMMSRLKMNNLQGELLVKAAKLKGLEGIPTVVDATAGMGEDAFLLAAAGFRVILFERDPVIAALLEDALIRASNDPVLSPIAERMVLRKENSSEAMGNMQESPDVIYLDPMFPERRKSASVKKKFQLLQQLERPCSDEEELLSGALNASPRKIVIKRPLKGPFLGGLNPAFSLTGKAIRYDCLLPSGMKMREK